MSKLKVILTWSILIALILGSVFMAEAKTVKVMKWTDEAQVHQAVFIIEGQLRAAKTEKDRKSILDRFDRALDQQPMVDELEGLASEYQATVQTLLMRDCSQASRLIMQTVAPSDQDEPEETSATGPLGQGLLDATCGRLPKYK